MAAVPASGRRDVANDFWLKRIRIRWNKEEVSNSVSAGNELNLRNNNCKDWARRPDSQHPAENSQVPPDAADAAVHVLAQNCANVTRKDR